MSKEMTKQELEILLILLRKLQDSRNIGGFEFDATVRLINSIKRGGIK